MGCERRNVERIGRLFLPPSLPPSPSFSRARAHVHSPATRASPCGMRFKWNARTGTCRGALECKREVADAPHVPRVEVPVEPTLALPCVAQRKETYEKTSTRRRVRWTGCLDCTSPGTVSAWCGPAGARAQPGRRQAHRHGTTCPCRPPCTQVCSQTCRACRSPGACPKRPSEGEKRTARARKQRPAHKYSVWSALACWSGTTAAGGSGCV